MNNIINAVNKDSVIVACKKRAKEILKNQSNNELTLMQCLDLAAKEMKFSHWYELRNSRKNYINISQLQEQINPINQWESLLNKYFVQDYDTLHFELRDNVVEIKGRKYGLIETIVEEFSANKINEVLSSLNVDIDNYGWLSRTSYNIQTMPVHSFNKQKKYYDVIVVKKDEFESERLIKKQTTITHTVPEVKMSQPSSYIDKLILMGFNDTNIQDIEENFGNKNIFISGVTGSGKSKTAEVLVNGLKEKGLKVLLIEEVGNDLELLKKNMIQAIKSEVDYFYIPEIRHEHITSWLNKIIQKGYKVITTIHSHSIDNIYKRMKSLGFTEFDYDDNLTNNLFVYQEMVALLCPQCKEKEFSFKKIVKNNAFMSYINKYEKHEDAENNIYKRNNSNSCKNPKCHQGVHGRKIIAETYNTYKNNNNRYSKYIEMHKQLRDYLLTEQEKKFITPLGRLREGKVIDYLRTMSIDCQSSKFEIVLKGEIEL